MHFPPINLEPVESLGDNFHLSSSSNLSLHIELEAFLVSVIHAKTLT